MGGLPRSPFVASSGFYDASEFRADLRAAYGEEIDDAWDGWLSGLDE